MKNIITQLGLLLVTTITLAQTYTIPGATEQPAWVFPLWFEDALGNKDTLYFGYDPEAIDYGILDTLFGEKAIFVDTSLFNVVWDGGVDYTDSGAVGKKVRVLQLEDAFGDAIGFYHTWYPPLTLRWDKNLFYSDALPFPENDDAPKAWGLIVTDGDMVPEGECSFQYPFIMTDTPTLAGLACYHADSMVFQYGSLSVLLFDVLPWQPYWTDIENTAIEPDNIVISPNPLIGNGLTIHSDNSQEVLFKIFDIHAKLIFETTLTGSNKYDLVLDIPPGIYVFEFRQDKILQTTKFIKL